MEYWKSFLIPKDTEEVKPNLFIQKKGNRYRQIYPAVWNNKIIWKNLLLGGDYSHLVWFFLILFLVFSYSHDVNEYKNFYEDVRGNPVDYCLKVNDAISSSICTDELESYGLCNKDIDINNTGIYNLFNESSKDI